MPLTEGGLILPEDENEIRAWGAVDIGDGMLYFPRRSSLDGGLIIAGAGLSTDAAVTNGSAATRSALLRGLNLLLGLVVDQPNGRIRTEINTLNYTEDSIAAIGEELLFATATLTTTTATSLAAAPSAGNHLVLKVATMQLREDVDTTASFRSGSGGADSWAYDLAATSDTLAPQMAVVNFGPNGWPCASATALYGKLSVGASSGVRFNVGYVIRED